MQLLLVKFVASTLYILQRIPSLSFIFRYIHYII